MQNAQRDGDTGDGDRRVESIVDDIDRLSHWDKIQVRDVVEEFGSATFIPLLLVPAILVVSPLSGIPLFSSLCGLSIALIASQMLIGRTRVWLPDMLLRQTLRGDKTHGAIDKMRKMAAFLDRHAHERWTFLLVPPLNKLAQAMTLLCGLSMPFLELLPFSSSILGTAVLLFSAGFLTRDGMFIALAYVVIALAAVIPAYALSQI